MHRPSRHHTTSILTIASGIMVCVAAACSDATPTKPLGPHIGPSQKTIYDPYTNTLGVDIIGPSRIYEQTYTTYTASVGDGTGPYHFDWFWNACDESECTPMGSLGGGWGDSTVQAWLPTGYTNLHVFLEAYDSQGVPYAGSSEKFVINYVNGGGGGGSGFVCDLGEHYYPIIDFDSTYYRRDGCTGAKEPSPTGNINGY